LAGKYGPSSVAITLDDDQGGTSRTITPYVQTIGGIKVEQISEEVSPFGVAYDKHSPIGKQRVPDIPIGGFFDTTATSGPHVVFGTPDDLPTDGTTTTSRTFTFTPGDSKVFTMECILVSYEVMAVTDKLSRFSGVLRQAGAGAWA